MKKVLFVDEKMYRFSHYYESKSWWRKNGIDAIYKDYEKKSSKYKIYLSLIINRPDFIVLVQLSTKNQVLMQIASLLRIKVIFWQHGIFEYPININKVLKCLPMNLSNLLALSKHDVDGISSIFSRVCHTEVIPHYDLANIKCNHQTELGSKFKIAYLGQIITPEQVYGSGARIMEQYLGEFDLFIELLEEIEDKRLPILIYAKQHPGDKSDYLKKLTEKYHCITLADNVDIFDCHAAISYFSTLMLAFMELNKPVIQLPMTNQKFRLDMSHYDKNNNLIVINSLESFLESFNAMKNHKNFGVETGRVDSISQTLVRVILRE